MIDSLSLGKYQSHKIGKTLFEITEVVSKIVFHCFSVCEKTNDPAIHTEAHMRSLDFERERHN